ncbi:MAG: cadmium-translocating P-type ATPase [Clostridiales bacterium]|uniref:heavy metal translocating P-type ATPase n=1 Tax=Clostridium sp. N3C TaxID=1776758 RepID=UPI00092E047F|nr:heavy metal translocating P-type ATPase [Clostridium sp. N3C]NLZ48993.1 cadmium-translocating P-type ATPase [Clostridiales bacterium]SCN23270.1 Cadmium, zinc and cobalt-transporting ATPase [Clostridium sp. N3C]
MEANNIKDSKGKLRRQFILEGLDCANCAAKIEQRVSNLEGIHFASVNFPTKTLTIEVNENGDVNKLLSLVIKTVTEVEAHVKVKEKIKNSNQKMEFILKGLDCANCAAKIEKEVQKLVDVEEATVDFINTKLSIQIDKDVSTKEMVNKIKEVVKSHEPEVEVIELQNKNTSKKMEEEQEGKGELIKLAIGALIFAVALAFDFPQTLELILFLISYIIVGGKVVLRAGKNILKGEVFDENFLMALATIGAFLIKEYPEAVAVMLFYQVGEIFQDMAVNNSRKSITALMDIRPDYANLKIDEEIRKVSPEDVSLGDLIIVKPGEKVPLDGVIVEGTSMIDTSALTGESVPTRVGVGDAVLSGAINKNAVLTIKIEKEFADSTVAKILDLVENAGSKKAPTEKFITKFARVYTPVVVFLAIALAIIPPLFVEGATFSQWLYRALSFLVVSCPCALVVSVPLGFFGGIGAASKNGILVKGGNYLEALNNVEMVVFDKTGTLTKGVFEVTEIRTENKVNKDELLSYAAYAEAFSNHPIATSILKAYGKEIIKGKISNYEEISGQGVKVLVEGKEILAGNYRLMDKENIAYKKIDAIGTVVYIALDKRYLGYLVISDEIKKDSAEAIKTLKSLGVRKTSMLTGDNRFVAERIGKELELDEVYAELLPDQKVEKLESLEKEKSTKGKLIFVGDGINDAPVLARADIGIAMGGVGSDAAIEASDVVIMTDEPYKIVDAIKIAKNTRKIVLQNICFALAVKVLILILVAIGLGTMWEAVFGDVGVTVIAVLNSMRAMNVKKL